MSYSAFTLQKVREDFHVQFDPTQFLFSDVSPVPLSETMQRYFAEYRTLGMAMPNEKGKSEFLVSPLLAEVWKQSGRRISIHTGVEFNVDPEAGLNGVCDFLLGRTAQLYYLEAPILAVVEAKKDSIPDGLGQCAAEMVAVQRFNLNAGQPTNPVYGLITTGTNWKFLKLDGKNLFLDQDEYGLGDADRILGILLHIVGHTPISSAT